jgi:NYN domain
MKCPKCQSPQIQKSQVFPEPPGYKCLLCGGEFFDTIAGSQSIVTTEKTITPHADTSGIAMLLLDAENIKLDQKSEQFLVNLCQYPLQKKMAFANWKTPSLAKLDSELYNRGYQLIHVPSASSNSSDAKMIAEGACLFYQYPTVKEVFVCSTDGLFNHLCHQLQHQGLTVYWVRRENTNIVVENCATNQCQYYSLVQDMEIPSLEELADRVEELLEIEYSLLRERNSQVDLLNKLFKERKLLREKDNSFSPVNSVMLPPSFNESTIPVASPPPTNLSPSSSQFNSLADWENALIFLINTMTINHSVITIPLLRQTFLSQYKENPDLIIKKFSKNKNNSLVKYLKTRPKVFQIKLVGNEYEVAIANPSPSAIENPTVELSVNTAVGLQNILVKIVSELVTKNAGNPVNICLISADFNKNHEKCLKDTLKEVMNKKLLEVLQGCSQLKVHKSGKVYHVTLAVK